MFNRNRQNTLQFHCPRGETIKLGENLIGLRLFVERNVQHACAVVSFYNYYCYTYASQIATRVRSGAMCCYYVYAAQCYKTLT